MKNYNVCVLAALTLLSSASTAQGQTASAHASATVLVVTPTEMEVSLMTSPNQVVIDKEARPRNGNPASIEKRNKPILRPATLKPNKQKSVDERRR